MVALSSGVESLLLNGLLSVILLVATISNSLLLFVFYRRPGLRTISNRFVINLLVTNLTTCWILLPCMLADNTWRRGSSSAMAATKGVVGAGGDVIVAHWVLPCVLFEGTAIGLCVACVLSVVLIGVDQYFAVINPLRYHASIKATTSALMIAISWVIAITFGVLGGLSANSGCAWYACERFADNQALQLSSSSSPSSSLSSSSASSSPSSSSSSSSPSSSPPPSSQSPPLPRPLSFLPECYRLVFAALFILFVFIAPFATICWIYLSICAAARQNHRRAKCNGLAVSCGRGGGSAPIDNPQEAVLLEYAATIHEYIEIGDGVSVGADSSSCHVTSSFEHKQTQLPPSQQSGNRTPPKPLHHSSTKASLKSTSSSIVNSLRHRISNASMFRYREETRAARISTLVIVMALFCWLPFNLVLLVRSPLLFSHLRLPHYVKQMGILSLSSNAVVSPLIFAHRNRRIHRELCRLIRVMRPRASFYRLVGVADFDTKLAVRHQHEQSDVKRVPTLCLSVVTTAPTNDSKCDELMSSSLSSSSSPSLPLLSSNIGVTTAITVAKVAATAACAIGVVEHPNGSLVDRNISIFNRLWHSSWEVDCEHSRHTFRLPEVAFETDTSRSSFSSVASTGSNRQSASLALVNDATSVTTTVIATAAEGY